MVFSFDSAAVVCTNLDGTSGFEHWSVIAPRYLKMSCWSKFLPFDSYVNADAICVVGHQFVLFYANFYANGRRGVIQVINERGCSRISSSFPTKPSISSAKHKLAIVLPPVLTVSLWSSSGLFTILSIKISRSVRAESLVWLRPSFWTNVLCHH